jgi:hypothetical protein
VLLKATTAPLGGAEPFSIRVPVDGVPPVTVVGFSVSDVREATDTVRVVVLVAP